MHKRSIGTATLVAIGVLALVAAIWPSAALADTGDISVGGVWVCRLTRGASGLSLEQRVLQVERRITEVLSLADVRRRDLTVEVEPAGAAANIVAADILIMTVTPADAAGTGVSAREMANQWAARLVQGLRRALPGREIVGVMYTQPRGTDPREAGRVVGITWYWRRTLMNDGAVLQPEDPSRYTVRFGNDGRVSAVADCNRGTGAYRIRGQMIVISQMAMTKMACPPGSLDSRFLSQLGEAAVYSVRAGILLIDLKIDSGTMRFSQVLR